MKNNEVVFFDIETNSLDPRKGQMRLIVFAKDNGKVTSKLVVDEELEGILKDYKVLKVFHNAKFDVGFFINKGYKVNNYHCKLSLHITYGASIR